jgi:hypothetical protein
MILISITIGVRKLKQLSKLRHDTITVKIDQLSRNKSHIATHTQQESTNADDSLSFTEAEASSIANCQVSSDLMNEAQSIDEMVEHHTHHLKVALQNQLMISNNMNNGINLTNTPSSQNIFLHLDPLSNEPDIGLAVGGDACNFILPLLLDLLKSRVQDERQYQNRKKESILLNDSNMDAIKIRHKKRKRKSNNANENENENQNGDEDENLHDEGSVHDDENEIDDDYDDDDRGNDDNED